MRVIVIGAGLGGLALAQSLPGAGVDVDVYERDPGVKARFQGYRIGLADEGLADLKACSPSRWHTLLDAIGGELSGVGRMVDEQLNLLAEVPVQREGTLFDRHVRASHATGWFRREPCLPRRTAAQRADRYGEGHKEGSSGIRCGLRAADAGVRDRSARSGGGGRRESDWRVSRGRNCATCQSRQGGIS